MKMIIEVSGGVVQNIIATNKISIYIIDHDNIKATCGYSPNGEVNIEELAEIRRAQQPDFITWEEGEELTPLFDGELDDALDEYDPEGLSKP